MQALPIDYKAITDLELASLVRSGDRLAYTEIYHRYAFVLLDHAYNRTRDREQAKDMVQEVFAMLWSKREHLEFSSNLSGFLYTSVRNLVLNQVARRGVEDRYLDSILAFVQQEENGTDHLVRERQLADMIEREIAMLSPKMREVFELSRREHLSHRQIAERLGISEQTVSKHVTNALKILKDRLGVWVYLLWIIHPK